MEQTIELEEDYTTPTFNYEEAPTKPQKEGLSKILANRSRAKRAMSPEKMKEMQDEWLKTNQTTIIESGSSHPTPYTGKPTPTNTLTVPGEFTNMKNITGLDDGLKDYGY